MIERTLDSAVLSMTRQRSINIASILTGNSTEEDSEK